MSTTIRIPLSCDACIRLGSAFECCHIVEPYVVAVEDTAPPVYGASEPLRQEETCSCCDGKQSCSREDVHKCCDRCIVSCVCWTLACCVFSCAVCSPCIQESRKMVKEACCVKANPDRPAQRHFCIHNKACTNRFHTHFKFP